MSALDDRNVSSTVEEEESEEDMPMWKSFLLVILGLVGLGFGGDWIVDGAVLLASSFAVSQEFIGMSVVAVGTSLPELATSMVAAFKKDTDIAIGNAIGSNIFNILLVLGVTSTIAPIPFSNATADIDVLVMTSATLLCFFVLFVGKRHMIERWQGIIFVILYVVYIATAIIRQ
jgi:cation:H+ antiporter